MLPCLRFRFYDRLKWKMLLAISEPDSKLFNLGSHRLPDKKLSDKGHFKHCKE